MKKLALACLFVCFTYSAVFSFSYDKMPNYQDEGMQLFVSGTEKLHAGDFVQATIELKRAVRLRPDLAEAFHNLGFAFERSGDMQNAAKAYERAVSLKPTYASALNNLGYLLATTEANLEKAISYCQAAVRLEPNSASFRDSLGWAYYKANRVSEATKHFQAAIKLDPTFTKAHFNLGLAEYGQENFQNAIMYFRNVVQLDSGYFKAFLPLADSYEKVGDENKALFYYRQALGLSPDNPTIRRHIERKIKDLSQETKNSYFANVSQKEGSSKLQEFMQRKNRSGSLLSAVSQPANNSKAIPNPLESNGSFTPVSAKVSGTDRLYATRFDTGVQAQESVSFSSRPNTVLTTTMPKSSLNTTDNIALSYSSSSVYPVGAQTQPFNKVQPRQLSIAEQRELERKYALSNSYIHRGLIKEAEAELSEIVKVAPEDSTVGRQSHNLLLKLHRKNEEDNIERSRIHADMAKDFFRSGQYDLAKSEYAKALRLDPNNAQIYKDLALLHYNNNNYDDAYEMSKKAIALDRTMKEAYVVLGSLYAQKGRQEDALRTLEMVERVSVNKDSVDEFAQEMISAITSGR